MKVEAAAQLAGVTSEAGAVALTPKGALRVSEILNTALTIVSEGGFAALTLRDVARRAGMRLSNLQHYFPTFEHLVDATLQHLLSTYLAEAQRLEASFPDDAESRFEQHMRFLLRDITRPETNSIFFSLWDFAHRNQTANRSMDAIYGAHRSSVERGLRQLRRDYPERDIPIVAAIIVTQIEGAMVLLASNRPKHPELKSLADRILSLILRIARKGVSA